MCVVIEMNETDSRREIIKITFCLKFNDRFGKYSILSHIIFTRVVSVCTDIVVMRRYLFGSVSFDNIDNMRSVSNHLTYDESSGKLTFGSVQ